MHGEGKFIINNILIVLYIHILYRHVLFDIVILYMYALYIKSNCWWKKYDQIQLKVSLLKMFLHSHALKSNILEVL